MQNELVVFAFIVFCSWYLKLTKSWKEHEDQKGIIWHACKCYRFPILLVPHFFYQYSFSSRHSRHKFRQRGFINKKIKTCDWLKCLQSPDICQICPENFWRYVPNVSRHSWNVLRQLSNVSDICQIFPTSSSWCSVVLVFGDGRLCSSSPGRGLAPHKISPFSFYVTNHPS